MSSSYRHHARWHLLIHVEFVSSPGWARQAEGEGFEPPPELPGPPFQDGAIGLSAIPPKKHVCSKRAPMLSRDRLHSASGRRGIRTPVAVTPICFRSSAVWPLRHPSVNDMVGNRNAIHATGYVALLPGCLFFPTDDGTPCGHPERNGASAHEVTSPCAGSTRRSSHASYTDARRENRHQ